MTFFKLYTDTGAPNYVDIEADPLQMAPAFYNHYDGTIRGMLTIYKITQKISAKQSELSGDLALWRIRQMMRMQSRLVVNLISGLTIKDKLILTTSILVMNP